jgi:hypothetical protein
LTDERERPATLRILVGVPQRWGSPEMELFLAAIISGINKGHGEARVIDARWSAKGLGLDTPVWGRARVPDQAADLRPPASAA